MSLHTSKTVAEDRKETEEKRQIVEKETWVQIQEVIILSEGKELSKDEGLTPPVTHEGHFNSELILERIMHIWGARAPIDYITTAKLQSILGLVVSKIGEDSCGSLQISAVVDLYNTEEYKLYVQETDPEKKEQLRIQKQQKLINQLQTSPGPVPVTLTFSMRERELPPWIPSIGLYVQPQTGLTSLSCKAVTILPNLDSHHLNLMASFRNLPGKLTSITNSALRYLGGSKKKSRDITDPEEVEEVGSLSEMIQFEHVYKENGWVTTTSLDSQDEHQKPFTVSSFTFRRETEMLPLGDYFFQQWAFSLSLRSTLSRPNSTSAASTDSTTTATTTTTTTTTTTVPNSNRINSIKPSFVRTVSMEYPFSVRSAMEIGWAGAPFVKTDIRFSKTFYLLPNLGFTAVGEGATLFDFSNISFLSSSNASAQLMNEKFYLNRASQIHSPISIEPNAPKHALIRFRKGGSMYLGTMFDVWYKPFIDSPFKLTVYYNCSSFSSCMSDFVHGFKQNLGYGVKADFGNLTISASLVSLLFDPRYGAVSKPWFRLELRPKDA